MDELRQILVPINKTFSQTFLLLSYNDGIIDFFHPLIILLSKNNAKTPHCIVVLLLDLYHRYTTLQMLYFKYIRIIIDFMVQVEKKVFAEVIRLSLLTSQLKTVNQLTIRLTQLP